MSDIVYDDSDFVLELGDSEGNDDWIRSPKVTEGHVPDAELNRKDIKVSNETDSKPAQSESDQPGD